MIQIDTWCHNMDAYMDVWSVSLTYNGYARKSRATHVPISWPRDQGFGDFTIRWCTKTPQKSLTYEVILLERTKEVLSLLGPFNIEFLRT